MNRLWVNQIQGILRMEIGKTLFSFRSLPVYLLAALPVVLGILVVLGSKMASEAPFEDRATAAMVFAAAFQFMLFFVVYPGCVIIFMNLIRGEVMDRSLHYYFLSPIRREVLLVGKFLAGWISASVIFCVTTLLSLFLFYSILGIGETFTYLLGDGIGQVLGYVGMTLLATLGYGAVFLIVGLIFRNPVVPAAAILAWEAINMMLPNLLKKLSVYYWVDSLRPIPLPQGFFAIVAEPTTPWLAVPGLLVFTALLLYVACFRVRSMEVSYESD